MPITRKLVAQDDSIDNQWLKIDHDSRYIENDSNGDWQFLFGPSSALTSSSQVLKITAKFDDSTFNNLKVIAYLYDQRNASSANASTCEFKFYQVTVPDWSEVLIDTSYATQLSNNYFYLNPTTISLSPINFDGGDTLMIEATVVRLGVTYRDRVYINHMGVYDSVIRLKHKVAFLDITKQDI